MAATDAKAYDAVVFDLLTALLNSWKLWNAVAGSAPCLNRSIFRMT
jgi:hypothetical protein